MEKEEKVIVSLTSYGKRIANLPRVLDTIFSQTIVPDLVVLNLAFGEMIESEVRKYLEEHEVEINWVVDTKVYKKLIPTLRKYPDACVISIDDDFLYPSNMIEDFISMHKKYPNNPISGNRVVFYKMQCHCGCASLTKAEYYGDYLYQIDDKVIDNCPSDDMVYTFFATKSGCPYMQTENKYFLNMPECRVEKDHSYSISVGGELAVAHTYDYLVRHFGPICNITSMYLHDSCVAKVIENIQDSSIIEAENRIRSSYAYRLGKVLLRPLSWIRKIKGSWHTFQGSV